MSHLPLKASLSSPHLPLISRSSSSHLFLIPLSFFPPSPSHSIRLTSWLDRTPSCIAYIASPTPLDTGHIPFPTHRSFPRTQPLSPDARCPRPTRQAARRRQLLTGSGLSHSATHPVQSNQQASHVPVPVPCSHTRPYLCRVPGQHPQGAAHIDKVNPRERTLSPKQLPFEVQT
jgi:hypothetical protein